MRTAQLARRAKGRMPGAGCLEQEKSNHHAKGAARTAKAAGTAEGRIPGAREKATPLGACRASVNRSRVLSTRPPCPRHALVGSPSAPPCLLAIPGTAVSRGRAFRQRSGNCSCVALTRASGNRCCVASTGASGNRSCVASARAPMPSPCPRHAVACAGENESIPCRLPLRAVSPSTHGGTGVTGRAASHPGPLFSEKPKATARAMANGAQTVCSGCRVPMLPSLPGTGRSLSPAVTLQVRVATEAQLKRRDALANVGKLRKRAQFLGSPICPGFRRAGSLARC